MTTQIPEKRQNLIDIFVHRNEQINLSAIRKPEDIYVKHILDSLELTKIFNLQHNEVSSLSPNEWKETKGMVGTRTLLDKNHRHPGNLTTPGTQGMKSSKNDPKSPHQKVILDLGTGGGFPLLPLAITYPDIHCIGLDTRKKKCHAINEMVKTLGLENVLTVRSRAEEYDFQADYVTCRAVAYADKLFHRALPLVKKGGYLILYKLFTTEEDNLILSLIRQHQLTLTKLHHYHLPDDETERVMYILQK